MKMVSTEIDFTIHNFPFGVASDGHSVFVASRLGDTIINLSALWKNGALEGCGFEKNVFDRASLNDFIKGGKKQCSATRKRLVDLFANNSSPDELSRRFSEPVLIPASSVVMQMPVEVGNYTDFYSSIEHATNVGKMFRDPANALLPNWKHLPVAYHGRASSIVVSGVPVHRPKGQSRPKEDEGPVFGPTKMLDFELEMAFVTYEGKALGQSISPDEAEDFIFGMVIFNDWSARDFQKWEYVPLGPFLAKNFASSISPWIVMLEALEEFRIAGPVQDPSVLPYLRYKGKKSFNIELEVYIRTRNGEENLVSKSNYGKLYWNMSQQLAHHTVNGCNIKAGDMYASGTISGSEPDSFGSMLELTWSGKNPLKMADGSERKFIEDGDVVSMKAYCGSGKTRVGFGEVSTLVLPALP